jgi:hypothetical protein
LKETFESFYHAAQIPRLDNFLFGDKPADKRYDNRYEINFADFFLLKYPLKVE